MFFLNPLRAKPRRIWPLTAVFCFLPSFALSGEESKTCRLHDYDAEVSLATNYIQSQQLIRYFFADFDSEKRPLPASGMLVTFETKLKPDWHFLSSLSLPLREESVSTNSGTESVYYFPKIFSVGIDWSFFRVQISRTSCLEHHIAVGVGTPLSHRVGTFFPPFVLARLRVSISENTGLNLGLGYSGYVRDGAFFFPVGFSYLL